MTIKELIEKLSEHDGETHIVYPLWDAATGTTKDFDFSHVLISPDGTARLCTEQLEIISDEPAGKTCVHGVSLYENCVDCDGFEEEED